MRNTNAIDATPRKRNRILSLVLMSAMLALPLWARAQDFTIPADVQKLSAKAKESVEVNMEGPMLRWASRFLNTEDPEEKQAAKVVANLKGIKVRSFEFSKEGEYSSADVESLRSQVHGPGWTKVVGVRSETDDGNVDVFFKLEEEKMAGIVIISAEPKELTFVSIVGPIDVDQLAQLGGKFGIPKLSPRSLPKKSQGDQK
ncbi:MAG: DUF4252 domain-containing protein [Candidatus Sulfotelmatobacter sp.]